MLVVIQLPFADARAFLPDTQRLMIPPWPLPEPNREFVRAVGAVRERYRGGLAPWEGEEMYCDARRALGIPPNFRATAMPFQWGRFPCIFRRYMSDGRALARVEVGFAIHPQRTVQPAASDDADRDGGGTPESISTVAVEMVAQALAHPFYTPTPQGPAHGNLLELRRPLARHLLRSTTHFSRATPFEPSAWWLHPMPPLVIAESWDGGEALRPPQALEVPIAEDHGIQLSLFEINRSDTAVKVWLLRSQPDGNQDVLRRLRIHLQRLHSDRSVLRHILRLLAVEKLSVKNRSAAFDRLQAYLNSTFRGLGQRSSYGFRLPAVLDAAYRADGFVSESERNTILTQLRGARLNIRRNVEQGLTRDPAQVVRPVYDIAKFDGNLIVGDQYHVQGQAGVVGPNAQGNQARFVQLWDELAGTVDHEQLSSELERLRGELRVRSLSIEHDRSILEIGEAAEAARRRDGSGALAHLARCGLWALETAREIGVDLAASAIAKSLGSA